MDRVGDTSDSHRLKWSFIIALPVKIGMLSKLTEQTRWWTLNQNKKWNCSLKRQQKF